VIEIGSETNATTDERIVESTHLSIVHKEVINNYYKRKILKARWVWYTGYWISVCTTAQVLKMYSKWVG